MSESKDPTPDASADAAPADAESEAAGREPGALSTEPAGADAELEARPKKKKRKKKKPEAAPELPSAERPELDASGRERPKFLLRFPRDPELEVVIAAFESGNYARVRELAPELAERTPHPAVKAAALELRRRIEPDPTIKLLLGAAIALFVAIVAYVYHSHG